MREKSCNGNKITMFLTKKNQILEKVKEIQVITERKLALWEENIY